MKEFRIFSPVSAWGKEITAVLYAYMDPSGTHKGSPVISISGFLADEPSWIAFDKAWKAVLGKPSWPSRLTRFHAFDCVHCEGEFLEARWRFAERLALYGDLVKVIRDSGIRAVSASVIDCFNQLSADDLELLRREENRLGTPLDLVFHMITQELLSCAEERGEKESIGVLFDQDDSAREEYFMDFAVKYAATYYRGDVFTAFGFGDSRKVTPLQAADLLAYGTHHLAQITQSIPTYFEPDFPVIPAFWKMLIDMNANPLTIPRGTLINIKELRDVVQKVKAGDKLPTRAARSEP